ncbi:MAG: preprotein translocase subunit YajC [Proteobacteria bacterium]|nr:preprotein translocase subunit YajC [Pseudomonadota bacterium]
MNPLDLLIPVAHAQAAPAGAPGGGLMGLLPFVILFAVFIFLMVIPQSRRAKQHREMLAKLQKGDEVVTNGGLAGRVADLGDAFITLEIADGVKVKFQKAAISVVLPKGSLKAA